MKEGGEKIDADMDYVIEVVVERRWMAWLAEYKAPDLAENESRLDPHERADEHEEMAGGAWFRSISRPRAFATFVRDVLIEAVLVKRRSAFLSLAVWHGKY